MKIGVSTACLYPQKLETSVELLGKMGIETIEVFVNTFSEMEPAFLKKLKDILSYYNMSVHSCHPFTSELEPIMFFSEYERRLDDILELYRRYFYAMNELGAEIFVFHGDRKHGQISIAEYAENFAKLRDLGRTFGITVTQENVERCKSGELEFISGLRRLLGDDVAFTLDLKQALRSGLKPMEVAQTMGRCLAHIHLNDNDEMHDCLLPGFGSFPFQKLFAYLKQIGYQGIVMIEVYRKSYLEPEDLVKSIKRIKNFI